MEPTSQQSTPAAAAIAPVPPRPCPLCGQLVAPDTLGLLECSCGWGGEGDPLEAAQGFSRTLTLWDRRRANGIARGDLRWLAANKDRPPLLGAAYALFLLAFSTVIYLVVLGLLVGGAASTVHLILDQAWLGVAIVGFLTLLMLAALLKGRAPTPEGLPATRERFPRLFATLDDVAARTGLPLPRTILLVPDADFFVYQRHPLRRLFRPERVLGIGAAALPMLTQAEAQAIVAHEFGHARRGGTVLHRYFGGAEVALRHLIEVLGEGGQTERNAYGRTKRFWYIGGTPMTGSFAILHIVFAWTVLLPVRLLWAAFHLARLRESRAAEFLADRAAIQAYGSATFIHALTGGGFAARPLHRTSAAKGGPGQNAYAGIRRFIAQLPADVISRQRREVACGFRSLEDGHPITGDRLRAALLLASAPALPPEAARPAGELLIPAGEETAESVELALTGLLRGRGGKRRDEKWATARSPIRAGGRGRRRGRPPRFIRRLDGPPHRRIHCGATTLGRWADAHSDGETREEKTRCGATARDNSAFSGLPADSLGRRAPGAASRSARLPPQGTERAFAARGVRAERPSRPLCLPARSEMAMWERPRR